MPFHASFWHPFLAMITFQRKAKPPGFPSALSFSFSSTKVLCLHTRRSGTKREEKVQFLKRWNGLELQTRLPAVNPVCFDFLQVCFVWHTSLAKHTFGKIIDRNFDFIHRNFTGGGGVGEICHVCRLQNKEQSWMKSPEGSIDSEDKQQAHRRFIVSDVFIDIACVAPLMLS